MNELTALLKREGPSDDTPNDEQPQEDEGPHMHPDPLEEMRRLSASLQKSLTR